MIDCDVEDVGTVVLLEEVVVGWVVVVDMIEVAVEDDVVF